MMVKEWEFPGITQFFESIGEVFLISVLMSFLLVGIILSIIVVLIAYFVVKKRKAIKTKSKAILKKTAPKNKRKR